MPEPHSPGEMMSIYWQLAKRIQLLLAILISIKFKVMILTFYVINKSKHILVRNIEKRNRNCRN